MNQFDNSLPGSSTVTPTGTPPSYLTSFSNNYYNPFSDSKLQQLLSGVGVGSRSGSGSGSGINMNFGGELMRRKSNSSQGSSSDFQYGQQEINKRPSISFLSNLNLTRPIPVQSNQPTITTSQTNLQSVEQLRKEDTSKVTNFTDMQRSNSVAVENNVAAQQEREQRQKRHFDPSREPKLLHFM